MKLNKRVLSILVTVGLMLVLAGCESTGSFIDTQNTIEVGNRLSQTQATPTDLEYSLERHNLIKRAYWVNGQREKAMSIVCPVPIPLGYVTLFASNGAVVQQFVVDGKVSSLQTYLTPDSKYYSSSSSVDWLPDTDGTYGENVDGVYFFTPDGNYIEWTGTYLYSDIPFKTESAVLQIANVVAED